MLGIFEAVFGGVASESRPSDGKDAPGSGLGNPDASQSEQWITVE
jgi:hypothetical protein